MGDDKLIEAVARAICTAHGVSEDAFVVSPATKVPTEAWTFFEDEARAAIAVIRPAVIEECAETVRRYRQRYGGNWPAMENVEVEIRAPRRTGGGAVSDKISWPTPYNQMSREQLLAELAKKDDLMWKRTAVLAEEISGIRAAVIEECARLMDKMGQDEMADYGLVREAQNFFRARDAIRALKEKRP